MLIIKNKILPFKRYRAMTIWPLLFVRSDVEVGPVLIRHEEIHGRQQREMLLVGFYVWYVIEWLFRAVQYGSWHIGYKNISFEREAYFFEGDVGYLDRRKLWSWTRWIKTK